MGDRRQFKAFGLAGLPELGSDVARECSREVGLTSLIQTKLGDICKRLERHPMGVGFSAKTSVHQLTNRVIRLFRQQYSTIDPSSRPGRLSPFSGPLKNQCYSELARWLKSEGAITELSLRHPQLPFEGIIDLVCYRNGDAVIVDYKAGAEDPTHRLQVLRYALLWWRCAGQLPGCAEIQYLETRINVLVTEEALLQIEEDLKEEIAAASAALASRPAEPSLGEHCGYCDVRQFCSLYWEKNYNLESCNRYADIEIVVTGDPSDHGFHAVTCSGKPVKVTCSPETGKIQFRSVSVEARLRLIGVRVDSRNSEIHVFSSTEVWRENLTSNLMA